MQCCWPPSVSPQPQPPRGFYTEWHCRIKYSLCPASDSVSGCEMSWSRQHCPFPSGLFHTRAPDNNEKKIQQQRGETVPPQKSSRFLISLHSADRNNCRAIGGKKAGYDGGWEWWSDCNYCVAHPTQKASFTWDEVKSWLTCLPSGLRGGKIQKFKTGFQGGWRLSGFLHFWKMLFWNATQTRLLCFCQNWNLHYHLQKTCQKNV